MRWQRYELLPNLVPDYAEAIEQAKRDHQKAVDTIRKDFAKRGLTADVCGPGGTAGERQLAHRISQEPEVLAAAGRIVQAKSVMKGLESQAAAVPREHDCVIHWPMAHGDQAVIAELGGI